MGFKLLCLRCQRRVDQAAGAAYAANVTTYYHYDLNGALVKQFDSCNATTYFQYGANQLVTQVAPTGTVGPWNFGYDAGLNRYTIDKGGTVSYYLWDGLNLLEERDSSGNLIARYSYGL